MAVEFKWIVLVKDAEEPHPRFYCTNRTQQEARGTAAEYVKTRAPGTSATVLELREIVTGTITLKMDAA